MTLVAFNINRHLDTVIIEPDNQRHNYEIYMTGSQVKVGASVSVDCNQTRSI